MRLRQAFLAMALIAFCASALAERTTATFDSNGVKIRYVMEGEGTPVILVHGFTATAQLQWISPQVFGTLTPHFKTIALDNRGHGLSGKPHDPEAYGVEMVKDIVRLMDHLEIEKAHVVGYSMGGFITMKLISLYPDRLLSGVVAGAGWRDETSLGFLYELADSLEAGEGFGPLFHFLTPEGQPKMSDEQLNTMNALLGQMNDVVALAAVIRGMESLQVEEESLRKNETPTLVIIGEIDPIKVSVDPMEGVMTNMKIEVIEGADHMNTYAIQPFRDILLDFLQAHTP